MSTPMINILLSSFPGLGLPQTLCIPVPSTSTIADLTDLLSARLPPSLQTNRLILTTSSNKCLSSTCTTPISTLLPPPSSQSPESAPNVLPLRLSHPLCGGKGGFGSQLRAAGGRMSSRKKRNPGEEVNGSNRNLDGRRLRTVNEAKALAEYLAVKPEMEKKEKEERRRRWEEVVEVAQRREEEVRSGKGKGRVDGAWVEAKEEGEAKVREAVLAAMKEGLLVGGVAGVVGEEGMEEDGSGSEVDSGEGKSSEGTTPEPVAEKKIFGWDEEEDDESESDDE